MLNEINLRLRKRNAAWSDLTCANLKKAELIEIERNGDYPGAGERIQGLGTCWSKYTIFQLDRGKRFKRSIACNGDYS
jgi:hypothetical protein